MISSRATAQVTDAVCLLVFRLEDRLHALLLSQVVRVVRAVDVTPLPQCPPVVLGIIDVQGEIVPVIATRRALALQDRELAVDNQFILAMTPRRMVALLVDSVEDVIQRTQQQVLTAKRILPGLAPVDGVVQLDDGLTLIHDLEKFLSLQEEDELTEALKERQGHEAQAA